MFKVKPATITNLKIKGFKMGKSKKKSKDVLHGYTRVTTTIDIPNAVSKMLTEKYENMNAAIGATVIAALYRGNRDVRDDMAEICNTAYAPFRTKNNPTYSKAELRGYMVQDKTFLKLYNKFKESGFDRLKKPSLVLHNKLSKIKCITYAERMKTNTITRAIRVVTDQGSPPVPVVHESITACAKYLDIPLSRARAWLKSPMKSSPVVIYTIDEYNKYATEFGHDTV